MQKLEQNNLLTEGKKNRNKDNKEEKEDDDGGIKKIKL